MNHLRHQSSGRRSSVSRRVGGASLLTVVAVAALLGGCRAEHPLGLSDEQQKGISRQNEILRKAGGDWNKVPEADKQFLIQGTGSEESAKQMVAHQGADGRAPAGQYGPPPGAGAGPR